MGGLLARTCQESKRGANINITREPIVSESRVNYDLVMVVTFIDNQSICSMLKSVIDSNHNTQVLIVLVNQLDIPISIDSLNKNVHVESIYPKCALSLSGARNIAIKYIKDNKIKFNHIMFPDDDSTFDKTFFESFKDVIESNKNYIISVYNANTKDYYRPFKLQDNQILEKKDFKSAISVNMILAYETLLKTGEFDESLGIGTRLGSAEDLDYYIRACSITHFRFASRIYNYHPSAKSLFDSAGLVKLLNRSVSYSRGYIYVMFRHKLFWESFNIVVRALLASGYFLVKLQFKRSIVNFLTFFIRLTHFVYFLMNYRNYFSNLCPSNNETTSDLYND